MRGEHGIEQRRAFNHVPPLPFYKSMINQKQRQLGENGSILTMLAQRNLEAHRQGQRFRALFSRPLSQFWNPFTGFDVVRFERGDKAP